ncbi:MAG: DUF4332 domain-containing protein [Candidatus Hodarchaeota archaeon]
MKPLQLGQLFALPLQSAIKAQNLALQETISFIEQFGFEEGTAKTFRFKAERLVEERTVDSKTGIPETKFKVQPFEMSIPLLAIVSPPSIQLQEMNVEFGVEVVEPKTEAIQSTTIPSKVLGSSMAPSLSLLTTLGKSNPTTMKVNMKIVREVPEGMARLADSLTDLLSGKPPEPEEETQPGSLVGVEKVSGIGKERASLLRAKNILTVRELIRSTETPEAIKELSKTLGVSEKKVKEWREKAKLLNKENE